MKTQQSAQFLQQKQIFGAGAQKYAKTDTKVFSILSNLSWFLIFSQNILHRIVDVNIGIAKIS